MGDCGTDALPRDAGQQPVSPPASQEVSVLVTGYGPFNDNPVNASFLIASSLPSSLNFPIPLGGEYALQGNSQISAPREVLIHAHPSPIPVSYSGVNNELPAILEDYASKHNGKRPDLTIHIGIASKRSYYSVETLAHRDGYRIPDIDGQFGYETGERIWKREGLPLTLEPGPAQRVNRRERETIPSSNFEIKPYPPDSHFLETWESFTASNTDLRISDYAGRYLCEFIFYASLALARQDERPLSVLFLHVPGYIDDASLEVGREIAVALIKAMVRCWIDENQFE
jgi:pyrrolidone-carboxylate peptidase